LRTSKATLKAGPVALIFVEDDVEIRSTIAHHLLRGFKSVLVFLPSPIVAPENLASDVKIIRYDTLADGAVPQAINAVINAAPVIWMYYCYNAEYLFYPFCETRSIGELLAFNTSEDRNAMMIFVIDLYAADLTTTPNAVSLTDAMIDATGYYALARKDPDNHIFPKSDNWIFMADCAGGLNNMYRKRSVESTVWRCFYVNAGCNCRQMRRSMIQNTTPIPAHGITASARPSCLFAPQKRCR
jgi:hypothetical protein